MKIIIPIFVGSIIGYFTNWLAIKMLFRPYYEVRLFRIKLPFTPGLIPKEKDRIGKSVGSTIANYLLTPEVIIDRLSNKEIEEKIKAKLFSKLEDLKTSSLTIKDILRGILGNSYDPIVYNGASKIKLILKNQVKGDNAKEFFQKSLDFHLENLSSDSRPLGEVLPHELLSTGYSLLRENKAGLGSFVRKTYADPELKGKLHKTILDMVNQNVPRLITSFIAPHIIVEKVIHILDEYVESEGLEDQVLEISQLSLDKILEMEGKEVYSKIFQKIGDEKLKTTINFIIEKIADSQKFDRLSSRLIETFLNRPIGSLLEKISRDKFEDIFSLARDIVKELILGKLGQVIKLFNISKIVEDEIQSFDLEFTEKLILDIAHKELKAITRLGGILGGLMGLLTPLFQMIY